MKTLFIEAKKKNIEANLKELDNLPDTIYIVYSIQYKKLAEEIKNQLNDKKIIGFSQILGCSEIKTSADILLIGQGRFHALNLARTSGKEVYIFDNYSINKINKEEIAKENQKERGKYLKFLSSSNIGIIISIKSGQNNMNIAEKLKQKLEKQGKEVFLFLADTLNLSELENFPVDIFINTACPGLSLDSSMIINYKDIKL
jgi:diphthamide biosynthesis enzyme Dph1/Dph2-like protein